MGLASSQVAETVLDPFASPDFHLRGLSTPEKPLAHNQKKAVRSVSCGVCMNTVQTLPYGVQMVVYRKEHIYTPKETCGAFENYFLKFKRFKRLGMRCAFLFRPPRAPERAKPRQTSDMMSAVSLIVQNGCRIAFVSFYSFVFFWVSCLV